jgi:hypothetical protein
VVVVLVLLTVLLGKGLPDALITIIKVNSSFVGASLAEVFTGVPVLAIGFVCVILGISLGIWTWKTMWDDECMKEFVAQQSGRALFVICIHIHCKR